MSPRRPDLKADIRPKSWAEWFWQRSHFRPHGDVVQFYGEHYVPPVDWPTIVRGNPLVFFRDGRPPA